MSFRDTWKDRVKAHLTATPATTSSIAKACAISPKDAPSILKQLQGNRLADNKPNPAGSHRGLMWVKGPGR